MSQANVEKLLGDFLQEFREGKRQDSVISCETVDSLDLEDEETWRTIRKDLEEIGITVAAFDANKTFIFDWFTKAFASGAFEEQSLAQQSSAGSSPCSSQEAHAQIVETLRQMASDDDPKLLYAKMEKVGEG
jgi:hypothetical protein